MSIDHRAIYAEHADRYHALVSAEDVDGELVKAIAALDVAGSDVLDIGAGTGRLTRLFVDAGARVTAVERAPAMLAVARSELGERATFIDADARWLPLSAESFDLAVAGWVFGHFRYWNEAGWKDDVARAVGEMERVVRPGGQLVVIETLGTGADEPGPPNERLAEYYGWLEARGFSRTTIRTDYQFADAGQAAELTGFFFGPEFGDRIRSTGSRRVIEHTGIWTCRTAVGEV